MKMSNYVRTIAIFLSLLIVSLPISLAVEYDLVWDANGNLVYDGKTDIYREYNELNQLSRTRLNNATGTILQEYTYDPIKERIFIKDEFYTNGSLKSSTYYFDDDYIVIQNSSGTFNKTMIYQDGFLVGYQDFDGKKYYVLPDHEGSAHIVLNESGAIVEENLFSPFTEPLQGVQQNKFSYEAKEYDSLVKDYNFHFRKYIPDIGYGQADTLIQNVYDPQSLNRYSFERNSPYNHVDPDGHIFWAIFALLVVVGIAEGVYWLKTNPMGVSSDATPEEVQQARIVYSAQAAAHAGIGVSAAALTSGASTSGTVVRYSAPTIGTLASVGAGSTVANQFVDNQMPTVNSVASGATTSVVLGQALPSSYGSGQFMATNNIFNSNAAQGYLTGVASSVIQNKVSEANPGGKSGGGSASRGSGSSGSGSSGGGGNPYKDYKPPCIFCPKPPTPPPPPPKPNPPPKCQCRIYY